MEVVGYDKLQFSKMLGLDLPSVEQNIQELGMESAKLLLSLLRKEKNKNTIVLKPVFKP